ncbi:MAG: DoxX-like family protein [Saprospiraceae bacterium]
MTNKTISNFLTYCIAGVWIINGLYCKILNFVPRHQEIVGRILGSDHTRILTIIIGVLEILMAVWIISKINSRLNAIAQITIVATMNIIEFLVVPDLLLWGRFNILFAFFFIFIVYCNQYYFNKKNLKQT